MRAAALIVAFIGGVLVIGWPNHWIVAAACFVGGLLAAAPSDIPPRERRGGYVHEPSGVTERVERYSRPSDERRRA